MKYYQILLAILLLVAITKADCFTPSGGNIIISTDTTCTNLNESYDANISLNDGKQWVFNNYNISINFSKNNIFSNGSILMDDKSNIYDNYFSMIPIPTLPQFTITLWREPNNTDITNRPIIEGNTWFRLSANTTGDCVDNITYYNNASNNFMGIQGISYGCANISYNHTVVDYGVWTWSVKACKDNYCKYGDNGNWTYKRNATTTTTTPLLWSITGDNTTIRNLSVNYTTTESLANTTDWRINNKSIANTYSFDLPNTTGWVKDYSSLQYNMIESINPPEWKQENCKKGGCYYFDSDIKYLQADKIDIGTMENWAINVWIKPIVNPEVSDTVIFSYGGYFNDSTHTTNNFGIYGKVQFDGKIILVYWEKSNIDELNSSILSGGMIQFDSWNMITASYSNITKKLSLYINSTLQNYSLLKENIRVGYNGTFFGGLYSYTHLHFCPPGPPCDDIAIYNPYFGDMDEIKVFNKEITPNQIKILYEQEKMSNTWTAITDDMTNCREIWTVGVTPTNLIIDGLTKYSNTLKIKCNEILPLTIIPPLTDTNNFSMVIFSGIIYGIFCIVAFFFRKRIVTNQRC